MKKQVTEEHILKTLRKSSAFSEPSHMFKKELRGVIDEALEKKSWRDTLVQSHYFRPFVVLSTIVIFFLSINTLLLNQFDPSGIKLPRQGGKPKSADEIGAVFKPFTSGDEFKKYIAVIEQETPAYYDKVQKNYSFKDLFPGTERSGTGSNSESIYQAPNAPLSRSSKTNTQILGIDEPDIVKTSGDYIYFSSYRRDYPDYSPERKNSSDPYIRYRTDEIKIIRAYPLERLDQVSRINASGDLLAQNNTLVVLDNNRQSLYGYDITQPYADKQKWTMNLTSGNTLVQARLYNGKIYILTKASLNYATTCPYQAAETNGIKFNMPCKTIYHPTDAVPTDTLYTVMALNADTGNVIQSMSFVGSAVNSIIYMSIDALYLANQVNDKTAIIKIRLSGLGITAIGTIPGHLLNQFSLDEYQGLLRAGVTIQNNVSEVYVLDSNLTIMGMVTDLGRGESIYSIRFLRDKAYVVTYRETDPFYVVDLANPVSPQLKGQLKIPGYSSYLHPLTDTLLVGIGKEAGKIKLSLFDVSNPENPEEISKLLLDEFDSEILTNHHTFLHDAQHQIFFIPGKNLGYVFSYAQRDLSLVSATYVPQVQRAVYFNNYLYIIGQNEMTVLDELDWRKVKSLQY